MEMKNACIFLFDFMLTFHNRIVNETNAPITVGTVNYVTVFNTLLYKQNTVTAKHAELRRKSKDWLALNRNIVSEWSDMSIRGLLFQ